uniref:Galectin n=1 Tax=Acrobeloides nanus TaxID=290746 RepID=A0A914D5P7_9BILA
MSSYSLKKLSVPFATPLSEKLKEGCKIIIHGTVRSHIEDTFEVEFLVGGNVALHLSFQFHHEGNHLILNSISEGNWGVEKKVKNPLHEGDEFHLTIQVSAKHYNIELLGKPLAEFKHRIPFDTVQAVGVKGGVELKSVQFQGFPFATTWDENAHGKNSYEGYGTSSYTPPVGKTVMQIAQLAMIMDKNLLNQQLAATNEKL